jgi:cystathionine beta-synthase
LGRIERHLALADFDITGVGRCMMVRSPTTETILADPAGSVLAPYVETGRLIEAGSWAVEGIGEDFVPPNADLSLVKRGGDFHHRETLPFHNRRAMHF